MGEVSASWLVRRCDGRGGGGCRALSGTAVDDPPLTHIRAGTMWQGQKEVDHTSMGSGWHAQNGTSVLEFVLALCRELVWIQHLGLHYMHPEKRHKDWFGHFSFKEVRSYFRKVSGLLRRVDVEGVAWK